MADDTASLDLLDVAVLVGYFLVVISLGVWALHRNTESALGYFLASRSVEWWALGMSLFASNIGSDHLVGLAGSGAASGIAVSAYEWSSVITLIIVALFAAPIYLGIGVYTTSEYLERRFSPATRYFFTLLSLLSNLATKIAVTLFAGAVVLNEVVGWDKFASAVGLVVFTGVYTVAGGLRVVVYTEVFQTLILIGGCSAFLAIGFGDVGGWGGLKSSLPASFFHVFHPIDHPDYPWTGIVFGMLVNSLWYWMADQVMVQRVLSARNMSHARSGCSLASVMKLLPPFLFVVPGMIARVLYGDEVGEDSNKAFALLVVRLMPHGLQGLLVAAMVASLTSALSSTLNSSSTIFTLDLYKPLISPSATDAHLAWVGRVFTGVFVVLSLMWVPLIDFVDDQLFIYIQKVQVVWAPQIAAVFVLGMASTRVNTNGAIAALVVGSFTGVPFFLADIIFDASEFPSSAVTFWHDFNYLNFCALNFVLCVVVMVVVSLLSDPPTAAQLHHTTWKTRNVNFDSGTNREKEEEEEAEEEEEEEEGKEELLANRHKRTPDEEDALLDSLTFYALIPFALIAYVTCHAYFF